MARAGGVGGGEEGDVVLLLLWEMEKGQVIMADHTLTHIFPPPPPPPIGTETLLVHSSRS